jgi:hypothetical protein
LALQKGQTKEAKLCFMVHALMENRYALVMQAEAAKATAVAERDTASKATLQPESGRPLWPPRSAGGSANTSNSGSRQAQL